MESAKTINGKGAVAKRPKRLKQQQRQLSWETVEKLKEKRKSGHCEAEGLALCFALLFSSVVLSDILLEKLGTDSAGKHSCMELADVESERENH